MVKNRTPEAIPLGVRGGAAPMELHEWLDVGSSWGAGGVLLGFLI